MKNLALLLIFFCILVGCNKSDVLDIASDPTESLTNRIEETGRVTFKSWNGTLRGVDSDSLLHFYKDSRVVLEDRSISVLEYEGSYDLSQDGLIVVSLKGYREDWPQMTISVAGPDFLLYRADGHTSWLPKGDPNLPEPAVDGYWPFRASLE